MDEGRNAKTLQATAIIDKLALTKKQNIFNKLCTLNRRSMQQVATDTKPELMASMALFSLRGPLLQVYQVDLWAWQAMTDILGHRQISQSQSLATLPRPIVLHSNRRVPGWMRWSQAEAEEQSS